MTTPFIIGLSGRAGAGKDTVAGLLSKALEQAGKSSLRMAFADPIRSMLSGLGVPVEYMTERSLKESAIPGFNGASYRQMAQSLGTEWGRHCMGGGFWTGRLRQRIDAMQASTQGTPDFLIITDVRFANEASWIHERGGTVIRIDRPGLAPVRDHSSESITLQCDATLFNHGDLTNLEDQCHGIAKVVACMSMLEA